MRRTKSCGCLKKELNRLDLTGRIFGRLTAIEDTGERYRGAIMWLCICSCGAKTRVRSKNLLSGKTKSCGCLQKELASQRERKLPYEALYNHFKAVNRKKHPIGISYEEFLKFTTVDCCHYCGRPVFWSKHNPKDNGNKYNLDRKDNSKGYVPENLVVCCKRCNYAKSNDFNYDEWLVVGAALREYEKQCRGKTTS
jgi:5-methylcytosine-specific restriction endonuclease McrA